MQIFQKVKNGGRSICVSCIHRKVCKGIDNQPCIECNQFLNENKKPQTNAEWIRSMNDKELAEFIGNNTLCDRIQSEGNWCEEHAVCENCLTEWLKNPYLEE